MREIMSGEIGGKRSTEQSDAQVVSWGGIAAGVLAAIAIQLLLNLLGIGIGASSINAAQGDQPGQGLAVGAVTWFVLSWVLSLAVGGWIACLFASRRGRIAGGLHGFMVWAVGTLVVVYLLTTAAGNLIGGTASVIGRTASLVGAGAKATAPGVAGLVSQATGITPNEISNQAGEVASDPKFQQVITDAVQNGKFSQSDRDATVGLLVEKGHMSSEQANDTINRWQMQITNGTKSAKAAALVVEDKAASGLTATGFGSFFALLLGLAAAVAGGVLGAHPRFRRVLESA